MLAIDTATSRIHVDRDPPDRIHAALATTSAQQTRLAIAAVARCLSDLIGSESTARLAEQVDGELRQALSSAARSPDTSEADTESSLVMTVAALLPRGFPAHACLVVRVVLAELSRQAGSDEARLVVSKMPDRLRKLWPVAVWKSQDATRSA